MMHDAFFRENGECVLLIKLQAMHSSEGVPELNTHALGMLVHRKRPS
jgi:hypothetical protein